MKTALRGILLILMLSVLSCGRDGIRARIAGIEKLPSDERFLELLKLNEEYPNSPLVKLRLGNLLTEHDNPETALIYLSSALRLESALNNDEERAELYTAGSRAALDRGEIENALSWARRAYELSPLPAPALALGLALARSGDGKAALSSFAEAYGRDKSLFGTEESRRYAELLATSGDYAKALDIVRESLAVNGYHPGAGAEESALLSLSGRREEAFLAAFRDVEYSRAFQDETAVSSIFEELKKSFSDVEAPLIAGSENYLRERYAEAERELSHLSQSLTHPILSYLLLACRIECGGREGLETYTELEGNFRGFQLYYYHLFRALRGEKRLSLPSYAAILSRCVSLGEKSRYGREARKELAGLILDEDTS